MELVILQCNHYCLKVFSHIRSSDMFEPAEVFVNMSFVSP